MEIIEDKEFLRKLKDKERLDSGLARVGFKLASLFGVDVQGRQKRREARDAVVLAYLDRQLGGTAVPGSVVKPPSERAS